MSDRFTVDRSGYCRFRTNQGVKGKAVAADGKRSS
jgi:hypothetical protein